MNNKYIKDSSNENLLIFFNGWGFDEKMLPILDVPNYDKLILYRYSNFNTDDVKIEKDYKNITVVAWSLGVWVAPFIVKKLNIKIDKAIAINGTLNPISDNFGIPKAVFEGTLTNLNERNLKKFNTRIAGGSRMLSEIERYLATGCWEDQKEELQFLFDSINKSTKAENIFDCAIIANDDLIFSAENQKRYWQTENNTVITEFKGAHFPFNTINIGTLL